jgi:hypothetical protein
MHRMFMVKPQPWLFSVMPWEEALFIQYNLISFITTCTACWLGKARMQGRPLRKGLAKSIMIAADGCLTNFHRSLFFKYFPNSLKESYG